MSILTISNLFPRPDRPVMGMFNAQLFECMSRLMPIANVCLVPSWRRWEWTGIRRWQCPSSLSFTTRYEPVFYAPGIGRDWAAELYVRSLRHLVNDLRAGDGVLAAWLYPDGVAAARLARESGLPCWILVQGSDTFHLSHARRRGEILEVAGSVAGFLCVSRMLADRLIQTGIPREKVSVVNNGVNTDLFHYRSAAECESEGCGERDAKRSGATVAPALCAGSENRTPAGKVVLFVGNLVPVKGPDLLIEAWKLLYTRCVAGTDAAPRAAATGEMGEPHCGFPALVVIGDGPMRKGLERRVRESGLDDTVRFLGVRPHDEIALWMNRADVLCLTSRSEGMPNVLLEALASGLPVVATDVGACREMLDGESGARIVKPGDADALALAISELLVMDVDREAMATRHGKRSWDAMAEEVIEIVRKGAK